MTFILLWSRPVASSRDPSENSLVVNSETLASCVTKSNPAHIYRKQTFLQRTKGVNLHPSCIKKSWCSDSNSQISGMDKISAIWFSDCSEINWNQHLPWGWRMYLNFLACFWRIMLLLLSAMESTCYLSSLGKSMQNRGPLMIPPGWLGCCNSKKIADAAKRDYQVRTLPDKTKSVWIYSSMFAGAEDTETEMHEKWAWCRNE